MTHHVPAELQNYVRQSIIPQYANFDKAHQIDHVEKVIEESLKLAMHYEVDYSMVYIIAAYHDLGLYEGREFHHNNLRQSIVSRRNFAVLVYG
jgi:hypothetical protein